MKLSRRLTPFLFVVAAVASATPNAAAQPTQKEYLTELLVRTRGTLTNMKHRERNFLGWSVGRWSAIQDPEELVAWLERTSSGSTVAWRLNTAREQTRKLIVFQDTEQQTAEEILAALGTHEAGVFRHALEGALRDTSASYDSRMDERSIHLEPNEDSAEVGRLRRSQYVTVLEHSPGSEWAKVSHWADDRLVQGYMEVSSTFELYAPPAAAPKPLRKPTPKRVKTRQKHHLRLLAVTAEGALSNLRHDVRTHTHAVRTHWEGLETAPELRAFFETNADNVAYRLKTALEQATLLSSLSDDQRASLAAAEAGVLQQALAHSGTLRSATFDSRLDTRNLHVAADEHSGIRTKIRKGQTFVLLDDNDPEWIKVRYFDTDHTVEGYMERDSTLRLLAAPNAQAEPELASEFVDMLPVRGPRKVYLKTLLAGARGGLNNMRHRERNYVSWSRGRWKAVQTSQDLVAWFEGTGSGSDVGWRLKTALEQARSLTGMQAQPPTDTAGLPAPEPRQPLAELEAQVLKHVLQGTLGEQSATFDSNLDYRSIHLSEDPSSPEVALVRKRNYVTLLEHTPEAEWAKVRFWVSNHEVEGYMEVDSAFEVYDAPALPAKPLRKQTPKRTATVQKHYLRLLAITAEGALSNLRHRVRSYVPTVRAQWEALHTSPELLAFFETNEDYVEYRLNEARKQAALLTSIDEAQRTPLAQVEAQVLKQALNQSAALRSATFDSNLDSRNLHVAAEEGSPLRTKIRKRQTFVLLDDSDPDWIKVRYFDGDHTVEGFMERDSRLLLLAAPEAQPAATASDDDSGFIDALLNTELGGR